MWRIRRKKAPDSGGRRHLNPEQESTQFRCKAAGFYDVAE